MRRGLALVKSGPPWQWKPVRAVFAGAGIVFGEWNSSKPRCSTAVEIGVAGDDVVELGIERKPVAV